MDLKWLEDFVSLARTGSFSRSAGERGVTQPAFSRRIQALELWLGAPLVDRSTYPTTLTTEGRRFRETAEETVRVLTASRRDLAGRGAGARPCVSVAALHTLSLTFFPRWFKAVEARTGPLDSRLLPDNFHNCLQAVVEGGYDFLLTFHHPSAPVLLDPALFPHLVVGRDRFLAARNPREGTASVTLDYPRASFLGRVAAALTPGDPPGRGAHVNENGMAEALRHMAREGHGTAWLPLSLIADDLRSGDLVASGPETALEIRLYRSAARVRPATGALWAAAQALAAPMPSAHGPF